MDSLFHIQWHITENCNLKCTHCYQDTDKNPKDYNDLLMVLDNIDKLANHYKKKKITLTGGEPFASPFFKDITTEIKKRDYILAILTNGTLIDKNKGIYLKSLNLEFLQISIDGTRDIHDKIRGAGNFDKAIDSIIFLDSLGIKVSISFTAHKNNYQCFYDLVSYLSKLHLKTVSIWTDRLVPFGNGGSHISTLNSIETKEYLDLIKKARADFKDTIYVAIYRSLQFLANDEQNIYRCSAGNRFLTILPNGDIYPCRRMPILIGNALHDDLYQIYHENKLLNILRNPNAYPKECIACKYKLSCSGGSKCINYALTGSPYAKDVGCFV